jgi:hypothetical protein
MAEIQAERTPNPNSLKFTVLDGGFFHDDVVAISSKEEAYRHPLAEHLFAISGVDDVFITPGFVTVSKAPSTDWDDLKAEVEATLSNYLQSG